MTPPEQRVTLYFVLRFYITVILIGVLFLRQASGVDPQTRRSQLLPPSSKTLLPPEQVTPERLEELRAAVRRAPKSAQAHNDLGTALGDTGDLVGAAAELETAIRLKPNYAEAFYNPGMTYIK
jgi:hypothetical protein